MSRPLDVVLVGIGGYGNSYVNEVLDTPNQNAFRLVGGVDPFPAACRRLVELQTRGVPIFHSMDEFYANATADLAVLSSPLHLHADQTCEAMERGSHVLCEKPLCVTPPEAARMTASQQKNKKHVGIGYQWSFSLAMQSLKADFIAGKLGQPIRMRTLVLWPRDDIYYGRNRWAGLKQDPAGHWILDSPVNNACAHFLHNVLYILGSTVAESVVCKSAVAELYRNRPIQNYDTAAVRITTREDVEILFITSHATDARNGPLLQYEFDQATVTFTDGPEATVIAKFKDGSMKEYGSPDVNRMRKLWMTMDGIHAGTESICGIAAASAHTKCVWAIQQSMPEIVDLTPESLGATAERPAGKLLAESLAKCYEEGTLPTEMNLPWARIGKTIVI